MACTIIFGAFMIGFYFMKECPIICLQAMLLNYFEPIPVDRPRRRRHNSEPSPEEMQANVDSILR